MTALLRLAQNFAGRFAARKRDDGVLDFHDLEQFALKLLWDFAADKPTPVAERWRKKLRFVFVDEYQDINAAQDKIIAGLEPRRRGRKPFSGRRREAEHLPLPAGRPENFPRLRQKLAAARTAGRFRWPKISAAANRS